MNGLLNQKFFRLLSEPSQVSMQEIQVAYDAFIIGDFYKLRFCHSDIYMYICIVKQE